MARLQTELGDFASQGRSGETKVCEGTGAFGYIGGLRRRRESRLPIMTMIGEWSQADDRTNRNRQTHEQDRQAQRRRLSMRGKRIAT